jgi:integrase
MDLAAKQKKESTYTRYVHACGHLARYFRRKPVTGIEAIDLEQYRVNRRAEEASHSAVDLELRVMRAIYNKAKQNKMIPAEAGPGKYEEKNTSSPRRPVTDEEYQKLLEAVEDDPDFKDYMICAYETSMRPAEITGLQVRHIRFGEVISEVPERIADYLNVEDVKSKKDPKERKCVPISTELEEILKRRMEGLQPTDLVFTNKGNRWGNTSQRFKKVCKKAGVFHSIQKSYTDSQGRETSGIDLYCFRATRITKWAELYNDNVVRLASGHKNPQIFRDRYLKLNAAAVMPLVGKSSTENRIISDTNTHSEPLKNIAIKGLQQKNA